MPNGAADRTEVSGHHAVTPGYGAAPGHPTAGHPTAGLYPPGRNPAVCPRGHYRGAHHHVDDDRADR